MKQYSILEDGQCKCSVCGKIYSMHGIGTHIWRNHGKGKEFVPNSKGHVAWNAGLIKDDPRVKRYSETLKRRYENGELVGSQTGKFMPEDVRDKISNSIIERSREGTWHSSISKSRIYEYKGIELHRSWEYEYAVWLDKNCVEWDRPDERFPYQYEGKIHYYTPDFYLIEDDVFIEIKGYETEKDRSK